MLPDNIFLIKRERISGTQIVLGDFGTAHTQKSVVLSKGETLCGNMAYRSPEVWFPEISGSNLVFNIEKSDVWSAGCVLFEMLEGKHPFTTESQTEELRYNVSISCIVKPMNSLPQTDLHQENPSNL